MQKSISVWLKTQTVPQTADVAGDCLDRWHGVRLDADSLLITHPRRGRSCVCQFHCVPVLLCLSPIVYQSHCSPVVSQSYCVPGPLCPSPIVYQDHCV